MKAFSMSRSVQIILFSVLAIALAAIIVPRTEFYREWRFEGKAKIREAGVRGEVINMSPVNPIKVAPWLHSPNPHGFLCE
jgi:hypothetical protein